MSTTRHVESAEAQAYRRAKVGRDSVGTSGGGSVVGDMVVSQLKQILPWVAVVSWMVATWAASYSAEDRRIRKMQRMQVEAAERIIERNQ